MSSLDLTNVSLCLPVMYLMNSSMCHILPSQIIGASLVFNMLFGFPANCYVLWLRLKEMSEGQPTEIFVFNTSLVELVFSISYVFLIRLLFFGCSDCEFGLIFFALVLWVGRPLFQSCICMERYVGVLHPVTFLRFKATKYRIGISIAGWTVIMISCAIFTLELAALFHMLLFAYIIFLAVKVFCCLMVLKVLVRPGPGEDLKKKDGLRKDKIKAFRVIWMVLVSSVVMYGPNIISLMLYYVIDEETFLLSWSISLCLAIVVGFGQTFFYLKRVGKFPFCSELA